MEVILTETIPHLGVKGDVKKVKRGYFNNFLGPKKMAVLATPSEMKRYEKIRQEAQAQVEKMRENAAKLFESLNGQTLEIKAKTSGKDTLYKALHENDIVAVIQEKFDLPINPSVLKLPEQLKKLGEYEVTLEFSDEHVAKITLAIIAE